MAYQPIKIGLNGDEKEPLVNTLEKLGSNVLELYNANPATIAWEALSHDMIPAEDSTYDIGSPENQWRSLYVSSNTIYVGGTAVGVDESGNLTVGGETISSVIDYNDIVNTPDLTGYATTTDVSTAISNLVNGAGPALDTLKELADALGNDASFASTITTSLAGKANSSDLPDQDLNTTDQVTFNKVTAGVVEAGTVGSLDTLDLSAFSNIEVISVGGTVNLTGTSVSIIAGFDNKTWGFGADGVLTFPDGSTQSTAGGGGGGGTAYDQSLNTTDDVTFSSVTTETISATTYSNIGTGQPEIASDTNVIITTNENVSAYSWTFGADGSITFPDSTVQSTAFLGGTPTELNDEINGNKLLISQFGDLILTDATGTLESNSGLGTDRGIIWDNGSVNGGSNSYIYENTEVGVLEIGAFTTSATQATIRLRTGLSSDTKYLDWTPDGVLTFPDSATISNANNDFVIASNVDADQPLVLRTAFGDLVVDSNGITFPDDTVQTTAYVANPGEPLFVVINSDGTNARSSDGTTWTQNDQLVVEGYSFERVAIANSYIAYVLGGPVPGTLAYATTYGVTPTEVTFSTTGTEYYSWVDLQYADGYTVAVGSFYGDDGGGGNLPSVPVWAYTTNGSSWVIGSTDPNYQTSFPDGSFTSVDYGAGGWFIVATGPAEPGLGAGGFFITSLSSQLTLSNFIPFGDSLEGYQPSIDSVVWDGSRWWINDASNANFYVSSGSNPLTSTWGTVSLETVAIDAGFGDTGPDFFEDAGGQINGTSWFVVANDVGQVLASNDGGETWIGSVPLAYTDTLASATQASPCAVTFTDHGPTGQGEKIVISNANPSDYNGTYYVQNNLGTYELYVDNGGSTPLDSTLFGALVSADVLWSHGQYIDSVGFGLETFLVGNDDEQLFTSTDLTTWTKVDDLNDTFAYWNDFSFNATWGATGSNADRLVSGGSTLTLSTNGDVTFPNALSIQNFNTESVLFKSGDTFGIAGDSNAYLAWQNYAPGQGPGKQSVVDASDRGVTFYVDDATTATTYVWEFTNDGTTYLASNSSSPISYLQTPSNNTDIGLYIGAGDGVTIAANDYTSSVQWDFTPQGRLQFPGLYNYSIGETEGGIQISSEAGVVISVDTSGTEKYFIVYDDGKVRLPGATYSEPASPTAGAYPVGEATAITVTNSPNTNWVTGNGVGINGMTFAIAVDGSGNATVTSISDGGTGHYVGETFGPMPGTTFGGTSPADDMYFEVTAINLGSLTALDLTKQTQILTGDNGTNTGSYSLADGTEGQIMYFVPASGTSGSVYVRIANARIIDIGGTGLPADITDYSWNVFSGESNDPTSIMMAIFADGAWCLRGGVTD